MLASTAAANAVQPDPLVSSVGPPRNVAMCAAEPTASIALAALNRPFKPTRRLLTEKVIRLIPAISITRPGGSSSAVATAGTVLASVIQPLCTVNRKCTAMTYNVNRINAENGVQACGQSSTA